MRLFVDSVSSGSKSHSSSNLCRQKLSVSFLSVQVQLMAIALKATFPVQLKKKPENHLFIRLNAQRVVVSRKTLKTPMATLSTVCTVGLSETFARLRQEGK
ncbi:unnamed protein product, partial [Ilex paraguariensis]